MSGRDPVAEAPPAAVVVEDGADLLRPLIEGTTNPTLAAPIVGVVIGDLVAIADDGRAPLVVFPGQPGSAALRARSTVDLHGAHMGRQVVLMFEYGDPHRPLVMGVLREGSENALGPHPGSVEIDVDGARMIVSAKDELVLRCGKASLTLTKAGKVLIDGTYVLSRSSGVNRVKGGSVQLN